MAGRFVRLVFLVAMVTGIAQAQRPWVINPKLVALFFFFITVLGLRTACPISIQGAA